MVSILKINTHSYLINETPNKDEKIDAQMDGQIDKIIHHCYC